MQNEALDKIIEPAVEGLGFEYVGCDYLSQGKYSVLRVYIDKEGGVNIDDCAEVSRQVGAVLDVEDVIKAKYQLEVSSPGLDRPLFKWSHYEKAVGRKIQLRTVAPIEGRSNFTGHLKSAADEKIELAMEDGNIEMPFSQIAKAHIVYEFEPKGKKQ